MLKKCLPRKLVGGALLSMATALLAGCIGDGVTGGAVSAPVLMVSTVAGKGGLPFPQWYGAVDGTGSDARFKSPAGITADKDGNVYVTDSCTVRKITPDRMVTTLAGQDGDCRPVDGYATVSARFSLAVSAIVATDKGNLLVADGASIRKIDAYGTVTTLAGNASQGGAVDGTGTDARFGRISGLALDKSGNLYVVDILNNTIRKVVFDSSDKATVSTLAGLAPHWSSSGPDSQGAGYADGTGTAARFNDPYGVATDSAGNVYVTEIYNTDVRKITPAGVVTTLRDGTGSPAYFAQAHGIVIDSSDNLYVMDTFKFDIVKVDPSGTMTTLAGQKNRRGFADGLAEKAQFGAIWASTIDPDGNIYVVDVDTNLIRKVGPGYTVGGTISGLDVADSAAAILKDKLDYADDRLTVNANGKFTLELPVAKGRDYDVSVLTPPPGQTCTASNGSGTATRNVENIVVTCSGKATSSYLLSGSVSGLANNTSLVLGNSNGDTVKISGNTAFSFVAKVASAYTISVDTQPSGQTCTVTGGGDNHGGGTAMADVSDLAVSCALNAYTIGVAVSGLSSTLVLQNNGGDPLTATGDGNTAFASTVDFDSAYDVTVQSQPAGQTCVLASSAGLSGTANGPITVSATCKDNAYSVGGMISGLSGTLVLRDNGGDDFSATGDGNFNFATQLSYNSTYNVTVATQPAGQTCTVSNGSGTLTDNVSNVSIDCVTNGGGGGGGSYTISGVVNNLSLPGMVLQDNGGDDLTLGAPFPSPGSLPFIFTTPVSGAYSVTVSANPPGQTCTVTSGGSGTATGNVTDVVIDCL